MSLSLYLYVLSVYIYMSLGLPSYILSYFHNIFISSYLHIYISTYITIMHIYKSQSLDIHCIGFPAWNPRGAWCLCLGRMSRRQVMAPLNRGAKSWLMNRSDESMIEKPHAPRYGWFATRRLFFLCIVTLRASWSFGDCAILSTLHDNGYRFTTIQNSPCLCV